MIREVGIGKRFMVEIFLVNSIDFLTNCIFCRLRIRCFRQDVYEGGNTQIKMGKWWIINVISK